MFKPSVVICASASNYEKAVAVESTLLEIGYRVVLPMTAEKMKQSGDFDLAKVKTWLNDPKDYHKRTLLVETHFKEIEKGDIVLVANFEKHGDKNYIGPNVLMEMGLAFHYKKPIVILNDVPNKSPFVEEILSMQPVILRGKLKDLPKIIKMSGLKNDEKPKVGVAVCIVNEGKVLVGKRLGAHGQGTWCFPGGHLEYGESLEICARREVAEECGLKIKNVRFATLTNDIHESENKHYITIYMLADWAGGQPKVLEPHKMIEWQWFSWSKLPKPLFLAMRNLVKSGWKPR